MADPNLSNIILTPYQIKHILPNAKFLLIFRNPVDRLYSSYNFFPLLIRNSGLYMNQTRKAAAKQMFESKSPEDFHNKVVESLQWFKNCTVHYPNSHKCLFWNERKELIHYFINHLQMGFYGITLKLWLEVFPRDQFKIIRLEDYSLNTMAVLSDIFSFLDLEPMNDNMREVIADSKVSNFGRRKNEHGPMLPETRRILLEFYKPYNKILADILKDPKFLYPT